MLQKLTQVLTDVHILLHFFQMQKGSSPTGLVKSGRKRNEHVLDRRCSVPYQMQEQLLNKKGCDNAQLKVL